MTAAHRAQLLSRLREPGAASDASWVAELRQAFAPTDVVTGLEELLGALSLGLERGESVPEGLREVIIGLLADWLVALGERPIGGLGNLVDLARRSLQAQERRLALVLDNLGKAGPERDLKIVTGYLRAGAAPMYLARVERAHPDLVAQARDVRARRTDVTPLLEDTWLLEALRQGSGSSREVQSRLDALLARLEALEELLEHALDHAEADAVLVAAALTTYLGRRDDAQRLLVRSARLDVDTAAMAVMAAQLAPVMTRHTLALLLADAAWGNPEEPEHQRTHERALALVAIEVVIHRLNDDGSVLASPKALHGFDVSSAPGQVERLWSCWGGVRLS